MNRDPFARLGMALYRARYAVVPIWIVVIAILGAVFATRVIDVLKAPNVSTPASDSDHADQALGKYFHAASDSTAVVVFRSRSLTVADSSYKDQVTAAETRLEGVAHVHGVLSYYDSHDPGAVSPDQHTTFALVSLDGDETTVADTIPKLRDQLQAVTLEHWVTGSAAAFYDGPQYAQTDVEHAEELTFPVVIVLLLIVFGTATSAVLPLLLGGFTVALTVALLSAIGMKIDTAIFALNVGSMLGLGLAIDYSLIVVTRFREENALWNDTRRALAVTMATAGRSITYSGVTVILAMVVLTAVMWPMTLIRSMSMAVLICAVAGIALAMTLLPAILALLGRHTEFLRVRPKARQRKIGQTGVWYRFSRLVMAKPAIWLIAGLVVLAVLAAPALQLQTAGPNVAAASETAKGTDALTHAFAGGKLSPIQVVIETGSGGVWTPGFLAGVRQLTTDLEKDGRVEDVNSLASALSSLPSSQFDALTPSTLGPAASLAGAYVNTDGDNSVTVIKVISKYDSRDSRSEDLLRTIRSTIVPNESAFKTDSVYVGGETATFYDFKVALFSRAPWAIAVVMAMIFLILMMFFESLFLPLKAVILNLLSLAATFGVLVMVFQHGWGSNLLGFDALGAITVVTPAILYVILFALSTDYEVFMLARVKEHYLAHRDNKEAVAVGLQHTAGLITAAALILVGTFGSFAFGQTIVIKELGVGLAVGVLIDSTVVRTVLVPATMALAGRANWWLPAAIKRVLPELSEGTSKALEEAVAPAAAPAASVAAAPVAQPVASGPIVLRLRSRTLPVVESIAVPPGEVVRIGRAPGNEIQIVQAAVSRFHARIEEAAGGWRIRDTSTNGTWVNGGRVPPGAEGLSLHNGDWIMVGGVDDMLVLVDARRPAPALGLAELRHEGVEVGSA